MSQHTKNHKHTNKNQKTEIDDKVILQDTESVEIKPEVVTDSVTESNNSEPINQVSTEDENTSGDASIIANSEDQIEDDYLQIEKPVKDSKITYNKSVVESTPKNEVKEDYLYNEEGGLKSNNLFLKTIFLVVGLSLLGYFILGGGGIKPVTNNSSQASIDKKPCINNTKKMDIPTNLKIEDILVGTGKEVFSGCEIKIHYKGYLEPTQEEIDTKTEPKEFDNSFKRGAPFSTQIGVGKLIKGWDIGIIGMKEGGKRKLTIPADLAYGDIELPGIPAKSVLVFEVELIQVLD
jgi:FKBP-type peptidyl-prolyl cis-trans isomerase